MITQPYNNLNKVHQCKNHRRFNFHLIIRLISDISKTSCGTEIFARNVSVKQLIYLN